MTNKKNAIKKVGIVGLSTFMAINAVGFTIPMNIRAEESQTFSAKDADGYQYLGAVSSASVDKNVVELSIETGEKVRFTFLDNTIFRLYMSPDGETFDEPEPNSKDHTATMTTKTDADFEAENKIRPVLVDNADSNVISISTPNVKIEINRETSIMKVMKANGEVVWEESAPLKYKAGSTIQTLKTNDNEYFYGGGTQNGYFSHKGKKIQIAITNTWVDQSVASPNPFYWSTDGYGVFRNTWKPGTYDFGNSDRETVVTTHNEKRFDAYYFIDDTPKEILNDYYEVTGTPAELPEYASYLGHLNCYNRDFWLEVPEGTSGAVKLGEKWYKESQSDNGGSKETLLGNAETTAEQIIKDHKDNDMPLGWFLPNDGYGCGYGQEDTQSGDIANLKDFADYAIDNGVQTGLWTQANLWPADSSNPKKGERDIVKEVEAGVHAVKTDVAWVGAGYSMALNGISVAYDAIQSKSGMKPNIVTLNGWAGTQRYGGIWTGDQSGGKWEYIRFHIPTYIGTSLSGQPNIGSDMDGIFGGLDPVIQTRDFQWKAFTTYMLDMDGWGSNQKSPWALGENTTSINRTYLKLKAQLMPYFNTISHEATALGGLPMLRAMLLEEQNAYTLGTATQYQYMWGDNFLVAPIYQDTASDKDGNDVRDNVYLPSTSDIWIDYFTGQQYRGGQVVNNIDAPLWKLPVFVKNGSIIPMYAENNNPEEVTSVNEDGLDRSQRIVEFYPSGSTSFNSYEDDGKTLGGASSQTNITSVVKDETATLTAEKSIGSYTGMVKERSTEFVVNVSKAPTSIKGTVKGSNVEFKEVKTQEEYDAAKGNVYFYNNAPSVIVKDYATEGTTYADINETTTPKLYVKSAEKVDVTANDFQVVIEGFSNSQDLGEDVLDESIVTPSGLTAANVTSTEINLSWDNVAEAKTYDIEVDGVLNRNIKTESFLHSNLTFLTNHTYRVRSVAANGHYSNWSTEYSVQTADDPYRNVPEVKPIWEYGDQHGALANGFDHNLESIFHSTNAVSYEQGLVLDYGKAFEWDKFEYIPRENFGNGTVQSMDIYASLDGVNYTLVWDGKNNANWTYPNKDQMTDMKTVDLSGVSARYLRININKSTGGFFSAAELTAYKKDGTEGKLVGDTNNSGDITDNDLTFFENYVGLKPVDSDWNYASALGDLNKDLIVDAFDISYVARQLGSPVDSSTATKGVEGKIQIIPSKTDIKAGDIITLDYYGIGLKNVNAFSVELPVDEMLFEVTNFGSSSLNTMFMRNFSKTRFHSDGTTDNYTVFTNVGKQELINGTGSLAKATIKATRDFTWSTLPTRALVVGQDLSTENALIDQSITPVLPETTNYLGVDDIRDVTFDNDVKEGMNGSELFQQSNWLSLLLDRDTAGTLAEFKWFTDTQTPGDEVKVPVDMNFTFKKEEPLKIVKVYNRESSNGRVDTIEAKGYDADGNAYDLGSYTAAKDVFEFSVPEDAKNIIKVVITPTSTSGKATTAAEGKQNNRMLSLREIEFITDSEVKATSIEFNKDNPTSVHVGNLAQVAATVAPDNVSNPFYNITSSDDSIASIIKIPTEKGYIFSVNGHSAGNVTLTAISEDGDFTTTMDFEVIAGVDRSALLSKISEFDNLQKVLYTKDSYAIVEAMVVKAKALIANENATQSDLDAVTGELIQAMKELAFKGSDTSKPDSTHLLDPARLAIVDYSTFADKDYAENAIDGNTDTIWHSSYQADASLPQWITIDLGDEVDVEQIDYLPRQNSSNGHITHYRVEVSTDATTIAEGDRVFTPVVEGFFENDGTALNKPSEFKKIKFDKTTARYVRFIALESLGGTPNKYASIAELNVYGDSFSVQPTIDEADKLINAGKENAYTVNSWSAFMTAYNNLVALASSPNASKEELEVASQAVISAIANLVSRASDETMQKLNERVTKFKALEKEYSEEVFAEMKQAIANAEVILSKDAKEVTSEEATLALFALSKAEVPLNTTVEALNENLKEVIDIANEILADDSIQNVRPAKVQALKDAIALGQSVLDQGTVSQNKLIEVITGIQKAAEELYEIVNKTDLLNIISYVEGMSSNTYTESTWNVLQNVLANAKAVAANDDATNEEVSNAYKSLTDAVSQLKEIANKEALKVQILIAEGIINNIGAYISNTVEGLSDILTQANAVLADENASQDTIDEITKSLLTANLKARKMVDKSALIAKIEEAEGIDTTPYTASSVAGLKNAIINGKRILDNESATSEEVSFAVVAITKAIDGLEINTEKPVDPEKPVEPGKPTEPEKPSDNGNAGNGGSSNNGGTTNNSNSTSSGKHTDVSTGDTTNIAGIAGLMAIAGAALISLKKKVSKDEE